MPSSRHSGGLLKDGLAPFLHHDCPRHDVIDGLTHPAMQHGKEHGEEDRGGEVLERCSGDRPEVRRWGEN